MLIPSKRSGFTLIELLVTMALLGVLAAIAIPQFAEYRIRGFNSVALSDLRSSIVAEEAYFADNEVYRDCVSGFDCELVLPGFTASRINGGYAVIPFRLTAASDRLSYVGTATHTRGSVSYAFDSATRQMTP